MAQGTRHTPVFIDLTGRRWRRIRRTALLLSVLTTLLAAVLVLTVILSPPIPPELPLATANNAPIARPLGKRPGAYTRLDRLRLAYRRRLASVIRRYGSPPSRHPQVIPPMNVGTGSRPPRTDAIVAGFFVNWEDNSLTSVQRNYDKLDWIIAEWGFVAPSGDSLVIRVKPQLLELLNAHPPETRPALFLMVSNFVVRPGEDSAAGRFDSVVVRRFLESPTARATALRQITGAVRLYGLAGTTLDMEGYGTDLQAQVLGFARELHDAMHGMGKLATQAVTADEPEPYLRAAARVNDKLFPMLFDEHEESSDPGPIASQSFYLRAAQRLARIVDPARLILMIGAYGYDWNDAVPPGARQRAELFNFQEIMRTARGPDHPRPRFDPASLNPYMVWTSADSTDHVLWYLDALSAYNEMKIGQALGVAGHALWRLGGEDPAFWNVVTREGTLAAPDTLQHMLPGYDAEFDGVGEILQVRSFPTGGRRLLQRDARSGLFTGETVVQIPTPYIVARTGWTRSTAHRVALTFDDGPDPTWTPAILDTLASRHVKATFFMVGQNVEVHQRLVRRVYDEGHEIGNHTFTHPNLALVNDTRTRLELDGTASILEAVVNRRIAFFRPPYFGDAEPTTLDELVPVGLASRRHYWTIGLHVDSEDWREPPPDEIVAQVLRERDHPRALTSTPQDSSRNVVLLHDAGGDRRNTIAALGPLIDSLRARGDTLVLVSELVGISRDLAMPPLPPQSAVTRLAVKAGFLMLGTVQTSLYWLFSIAVVLGVARLVLIGALAVIQRLRRHQQRDRPVTFTPAVSVIVPAFNEERVIVQTVTALLRQRYAGPLEVVIVDDGSSDDTLDIVQEAYGAHPQVSILAKENGGKASALNHGIVRARHEIVVALDADTVFADDTVGELVQPLRDPRTAAVAGNAKVGNRINLVTRWQALEYVTSQNLDRRAFSLLDCITVVPGAVGAWRRQAVVAAGGFQEDTLAEDQDLTLAVRRAGHSVAYADGAIAYTEAPDTLRGLAKQRFRWSFGTLQCTWKHRDAFFRPRYGSLGWIALPNVLLFQLLLPAVSPLADLMFVLSLVSVWVNALSHKIDGRLTYALVDMEKVLTYYAVFLLVDWLAAVLAFVLEPDEETQLTWLVFLQRFAYRQVMYWVVVRSFAAALSGRLVGWGKLDRQATVALPARRRRAWRELLASGRHRPAGEAE